MGMSPADFERVLLCRLYQRFLIIDVLLFNFL